MDTANLMDLITDELISESEDLDETYLRNCLYEVGRNLYLSNKFRNIIKEDIIQEEWDSFMVDSKIWGNAGDKDLHDRACQVFIAFINHME